MPKAPLLPLVKGKKADYSIKEKASYLDIVGFNYAEIRYDIDGKLHPEGIIVGSQTMASRCWYNWPRVMKYKYLIEDFAWAGFDYIGEVEPNLAYWDYKSQPGLQFFMVGGPSTQLETGMLRTIISRLFLVPIKNHTLESGLLARAEKFRKCHHGV